MKRNTAFLLLALAAAAPAHSAPTPRNPGDPPERAEQIHYQLILPEEKAPEVVKPNEPNPFSKADTKTIKEDGASGEENHVREILNNLPVTGYAEGGGDGPRVMVGPFKLKRNDFVPQVLPEQSVRLRVNSISKTQIDLVWVEKKNKNTGLAPRVFTLPIHVTTPKVKIKPVDAPQAVAKGSSGSFYQDRASNLSYNDPATPPETRRATAVEDDKSSPAGKGAAEDHPANTIVNFFKSLGGNKPVDTQPQPPPPSATPAAPAK